MNGQFSAPSSNRIRPVRAGKGSRSWGTLAILVAALLLPTSALAEEEPGWDASKGGPSPMSFTIGDWSGTLAGYVRTGFTWVGVQGENRPEWIGANNGFSLLDGRLGVVVRYLESLEIKVQFDGSGDVRDGVNDAVGHQTVVLKDAYGAYRFGDYFGFLAGQSKPPIDIEALQSTGDLVFIRRSLVSEGVQPGEGIEASGNEGLGAHREIGLHLLSDVIDFGAVGLRYHTAITNGNSWRNTRNDNNELAYYGRLEFHLLNALLGNYAKGSFLVLGGSIAHNTMTVGELPNQLGVGTLTWAGDLQFNAFGVEALAEVIGRTTTYPDTAQAEQKTMGIVGQLAYRLALPNYRFLIGARYASLDPFVDDSDDPLVRDDKLDHITVGIGYQFENLPVDLKLNVTLAKEEGSAEIDNDVVEALVQFIW